MRVLHRVLHAVAFASFAATAADCSSSSSLPVATTADAASTSSSHATVATSAIATVAFTTETPRAAGAFVDSIGLNIHLSEGGTPYTNDFSTLVQQISALGIHHVRDGMHVGQTWLCQEAQTLAASGIRFTYITDVGNQASDITSWAACAGAAAEAFEGPNEYDLNHPATDGSWPKTLATFQQLLYRTVKGNAPTANLPVLGPALTSSSAYQSLGDLSEYEDEGNMHDYFAGRNPGTPGWGDGGYGSISYNIATAKQASLSKSIAATETGFAIATTPVNPYVTEWIAGKYMPRLFLDHWNAGVPRTWAYELYDEGSAPFNTYGWVHGSTLGPEWSYWAMKNFISVIADKSLNLSNPNPLSWSLSGQTQNVEHTTLQKADGSRYLVLWIETPSNDPNSGQVFSITPQSITVTFSTVPKSLTAYSYDSNMNFNPVTLTPNASVTITLTDMVTVLRLT